MSNGILFSSSSKKMKNFLFVDPNGEEEEVILTHHIFSWQNAIRMSCQMFSVDLFCFHRVSSTFHSSRGAVSGGFFKNHRTEGTKHKPLYINKLHAEILENIEHNLNKLKAELSFSSFASERQ
jgi:hypothetical protein